jgi:hypothetical protein
VNAKVSCGPFHVHHACEEGKEGQVLVVLSRVQQALTHLQPRFRAPPLAKASVEAPQALHALHEILQAAFWVCTSYTYKACMR